MKKSKQLPQHTMSVYICGDCFSVPDFDPDYRFHWTTKLAFKIKHFSDKVRLVNLASPNPTNFGVGLQIEKALLDPTTCFIIVNATWIFDVIVPTKLVEPVNKNFWRHKGIINEGYVQVFKQPFLKYAADNGFYIGAELLEKFTVSETYNQPAELRLYDSIGVWSLYRERKYRETNNVDGIRFSNKLWEDIRNFFANQFDVNVRWNEDYSIIEGKLYKLLTKNIDFTFNLGGLADSVMAPLGIDQEKIIPKELKPYMNPINMYNFPRHDLYQPPGFHISNPAEHDKIANEYFSRIIAPLKRMQNASSTTTG